jgi:hypothetical protein
MKSYLTSKEDKHLMSVYEEDEYHNSDRRNFRREQLEYELRHEEPELYKARLKRINLETK